MTGPAWLNGSPSCTNYKLQEVSTVKKTSCSKTKGKEIDALRCLGLASRYATFPLHHARSPSASRTSKALLSEATVLQSERTFKSNRSLPCKLFRDKRESISLKPHP